MPTDALGTCVVRRTSLTAAATLTERSGARESTACARAATGSTLATSRKVANGITAAERCRRMGWLRRGNTKVAWANIPPHRLAAATVSRLRLLTASGVLAPAYGNPYILRASSPNQQAPWRIFDHALSSHCPVPTRLS